MSVRVNVKPLMHWLIYRGYTVRITKRAPGEVEGIMTTPDGSTTFRYDAAAQVVHLPEKVVAINEYGWEIDPP
ncbi:MAG: hypothetical protein IT328_05640 [Caldilineaceae bacterium]|nr:hypothetical protein [Caldilineaceae bacterium]